MTEGPNEQASFGHQGNDPIFAPCVRERTAARDLAVPRRIALDLLRADVSTKASPKGKRKAAAWNDAYMAKLLKG